MTDQSTDETSDGLACDAYHGQSHADKSKLNYCRSFKIAVKVANPCTRKCDWVQVETVGCRAERACLRRRRARMPRQHQPVSHRALMLSETGFCTPKFQSREHRGAVKCHTEKHKPQEKSVFKPSASQSVHLHLRVDLTTWGV